MFSLVSQAWRVGLEPGARIVVGEYLFDGGADPSLHNGSGLAESNAVTKALARKLEPRGCGGYPKERASKSSRAELLCEHSPEPNRSDTPPFGAA